MTENTAINEFAKIAKSKQDKSPNTFMEWLRVAEISLADIPIGEQFWLKSKN